MSGIVPRTGEFIFQEAERLKENGFVCQIKAACFEIYCEDVRDLSGNGLNRLKLM
jgi:hypothetical protein